MSSGMLQTVKAFLKVFLEAQGFEDKFNIADLALHVKTFCCMSGLADSEFFRVCLEILDEGFEYDDDKDIADCEKQNNNDWSFFLIHQFGEEFTNAPIVLDELQPDRTSYIELYKAFRRCLDETASLAIYCPLDQLNNAVSLNSLSDDEFKEVLALLSGPLFGILKVKTLQLPAPVSVFLPIMASHSESQRPVDREVCPPAPKKKRMGTTTSTTRARSPSPGADADPFEASTSSDDSLDEFCTATKSPKNTSIDGCSISLCRPGSSFTWKSNKFPVNWDKYIDLKIYDNLKEVKKASPKDLWKHASFRAKIVTGNPLLMEENKRINELLKELKKAIMIQARNFPGVATDRIDRV